MLLVPVPASEPVSVLALALALALALEAWPDAQNHRPVPGPVMRCWVEMVLILLRTVVHVGHAVQWL